MGDGRAMGRWYLKVSATVQNAARGTQAGFEVRNMRRGAAVDSVIEITGDGLTGRLEELFFRSKWSSLLPAQSREDAKAPKSAHPLQGHLPGNS